MDANACPIESVPAAGAVCVAGDFRDLIDRCRVAFGKDDGRLAELMGVSPQDVSKYRSRNRIPTDRWSAILAAAVTDPCFPIRPGDLEQAEALRARRRREV